MLNSGKVLHRQFLHRNSSNAYEAFANQRRNRLKMIRSFQMISATDSHPSIAYASVDLRDGMPDADLSIERALTFIPEPAKSCYRMMYEWFMDNSGTVGKQLSRNDLSFPDRSFTPYAQRGIHVPAGQKYAANVTSRLGSIYSETDQPLIELPDGTWSLVYAAHRNNRGNETYSRWNDALMENMRDGVPVGVYLQTHPGSSSYYRALAYVESYRAELGVFLLRGPVTRGNATVFESPLKQRLQAFTGSAPSADELVNEVKTYELVRAAVRRGQETFRRQLMEAYDGRCAVTACNVPEVLQAAHIIDHRGVASNIPSNGLLLRSDIHLLYDRGLLSVEPESLRIVTGSHLKHSPYEELDGRELLLPKQSEFLPDKRYLYVKHREFEMIQRAS